MPLPGTRTTQKFRTPSIAADWLLNHLTEEGLSLAEASRALQLPPGCLEARGGFLQLKVYNALFEWAAEQLDDECLGVHIAESMGLAGEGMLGYLQLNSATLGDFCSTTERYLAIFQPGATISFPVKGDVCECHYRVSAMGIPNMRQDVEFTIAMGVLFFREQLGADWVPQETFLSHGPPVDTRVHAALWGETIHYNAAHNGFNFNAELLQTPVSQSDPRLLEVLRNQANQLLSRMEEQPDFVQQVRLLIATSIATEPLSADQLARKLYMTRRTLHRRLSEAGISYQALKDEVVVEVAKEALIATDFSVTTLAQQIGYSETSAFVRAFRRITGTTPLAYRKSHP